MLHGVSDLLGGTLLHNPPAVSDGYRALGVARGRASPPPRPCVFSACYPARRARTPRVSINPSSSDFPLLGILCISLPRLARHESFNLRICSATHTLCHRQSHPLARTLQRDFHAFTRYTRSPGPENRPTTVEPDSSGRLAPDPACDGSSAPNPAADSELSSQPAGSDSPLRPTGPGLSYAAVTVLGMTPAGLHISESAPAFSLAQLGSSNGGCRQHDRFLYPPSMSSNSLSTPSWAPQHQCCTTTPHDPRHKCAFGLGGCVETQFHQQARGVLCKMGVVRPPSPAGGAPRGTLGVRLLLIGTGGPNRQPHHEPLQRCPVLCHLVWHPESYGARPV